MDPEPKRMVRAQALLEETLAGHPSGMPAIALVDRLERWGYPESEGLALLVELQKEGRLRVEGGRFRLP